jgi:uncharacterized protein
MPLLVNLRQLENDPIRLRGELPASELDLDMRDEMIRAELPLKHDLEVDKLESNLLVRGSLSITLECRCVRCLRPFQHELSLPDWTLHVPLQGEEQAAVVNDSVDLTPWVREDILLAFPQHPLCERECRGLPKKDIGKPATTGIDQAGVEPSAWSELDKLKFRS